MKNTGKLLRILMLIVIMAVMLTTSALAASVEATVNTHMLNVREGKGTQYTIIDVLYEGNTVKVVKDDGSGWVKVKVNGHSGWVNKLFLTFKEELPITTPKPKATATPKPTAKPKATATPKPQVTQEVTGSTTTTQGTTGKVTGDGVYLRSGPSTSSSILDTLSKGTKVKVNGVCGEWYEVNCGGKAGYIHSKYLKVKNGDLLGLTGVTVEQTSAPAATATPKPTAKPTATPKPTEAPSATGQAIVDTAMKCIGVPYVWAGSSPEEGFDCSGLVYYCCKANGITVNRVAQSMYYNGKAVDLSKLKVGDILLFGDSVYNIWHAGLYVGDGQFIHSPHSGASVRVESLSDLYGMRLVAARRVTKK